MKPKLVFPECVRSLHHALLRACDLEPMRPSDNDDREWWEFMKEMEPLEDTEKGAFGLDDLVNAMAEIRKENEKRDRQFRVKLVPIKILRDPAKFRDIVLDVRRRSRMRRRPAIRVEAKLLGDGFTSAVEIDPAAEANAEPINEALADQLSELSASLRRVKP